MFPEESFHNIWNNNTREILSTNVLIVFYEFVNEKKNFLVDCDLEDTTKANKPPQTIKMLLFYYKIGLIKLHTIAKVTENQKFKCIYLGAMILCLHTY